MGKLYATPGKKATSWGIDYYADGRRIRRIIGPNRKAAEQELKKAEGQAASGQGAGPYGSRKIRFRDFAERYAEYQEARVKPRSLKRYMVSLKVLVLAFGDMQLTNLHQADVERYITARSRAVKPWSVVEDINVLKQMLGLAVRWGYLWRNPAQDVKRPRAQYRTRHLTEPEQHLLLAFCPPNIRAVVSLAFLTGMRMGELLGLTWDRVYFDQRRIYLPDTKAGEPQTVWLNDTAVAELQTIPRHPGESRVFPFSYQPVYRHFRVACRQAGISDFRFHDCRHTFCSRLVELGANLRAVQALARHKKIEMTTRYVHVRDDYLGATVQILNPDPLGRNPVRSLDGPGEKERK